MILYSILLPQTDQSQSVVSRINHYITFDGTLQIDIEKFKENQKILSLRSYHLSIIRFIYQARTEIGSA
jgi:hypothetical protein